MKPKILFILLALLLIASFGVTSISAQDYHQSPALDDQVTAGTLPPVAERLPSDPDLVQPFNEVGQYGGTMRIGFTGTNPGWGGLWYITGWENLVEWAPDFSGVVPNIAESWEANADATEYTFHLRPGMKWSDGLRDAADPY